MVRTFFSAAVLFVAVAGLSGCMTEAHTVQFDAQRASVIVAVPNDGNSFPTYYEDEARRKAKEELHTPNVELVKKYEFDIGSLTRNDTRTDRRPIGPDGKPLGELTTNTNTTTKTELKEFRYEFRARQTGAVQPNGNGVTPASFQQPAGPMPTQMQGQPVGTFQGIQPNR